VYAAVGRDLDAGDVVGEGPHPEAGGLVTEGAEFNLLIFREFGRDHLAATCCA
jgi:hypothetical protein